MPLDPYFAERLRVHRRYLVRQAWKAIRARFDRPAASSDRVSAGPRSEPPATPTGSRSARLRARHRRAALAWDRDELRNAGIPGPDVPTAEYEIPVPGFPAVRVRVYRPAADDVRRPAVLTFHGGAFRIGSIDYPTSDAECRRRAAEADVTVVTVAYALAPEHRFPTQVEQAHAALEWLIHEAENLRVDPARIAVAGTSAGGALAAAVTLMNRDRHRHPIQLQILEVPVTDLTGRVVDLRPTWAMGLPAIFVLNEMASITRTYLGDRTRARHPYASPLRAADHRDLPPALILTAEYDNLRRDGSAYGAALRRSGVPATVVRYAGVTHDVPLYTKALPASERWHRQVVDALRSLHDE